MAQSDRIADLPLSSNDDELTNEDVSVINRFFPLKSEIQSVENNELIPPYVERTMIDKNEKKRIFYMIAISTLLFALLGNAMSRGIMNKLGLKSEKMKMIVLTLIYVAFIIVLYKRLIM